MPNETIADIVREMRECGADYTSGGCGDCKGFDCRDVRMFADRIEAAAKATIFTDNSETLRNALAENDRLRAALKPVLECATPDNIGWKEVWNYSDAVRDAKRIVKEGEVKND